MLQLEQFERRYRSDVPSWNNLDSQAESPPLDTVQGVRI
jgi:hypothetical protein